MGLKQLQHCAILNVCSRRTPQLTCAKINFGPGQIGQGPQNLGPEELAAWAFRNVLWKASASLPIASLVVLNSGLHAVFQNPPVDCKRDGGVQGAPPHKASYPDPSANPQLACLAWY